jgi:hypothetical protein
MNRDHLRSNGHSAQVERIPKRVDYPRLLALGREWPLAIGEDLIARVPRDATSVANAWREFMSMILVRSRQRLPRRPPTSWYVCPAYGSHRSVSTISCHSGVMSPLVTSPTQKWGLKFAHCAQFAHRLQPQERLGEQIAMRSVGHRHTERGGGAQREHYCMAARGIRLQHA